MNVLWARPYKLTSIIFCSGVLLGISCKEQRSLFRGNFNEKQRAELDAKRQQEWKEKERLSQDENKLQEMARIRRSNLFIAAERWEDSERALAYLNALEKCWRDSAVGELSPAQSQWLAWARDEAWKVAPAADDYPDPESVQRCNPAAIPVGGPYPTMTKLKRSEFSREEPKPESSPYSSYPGYSRY